MNCDVCDVYRWLSYELPASFIAFSLLFLSLTHTHTHSQAEGKSQADSNDVTNKLALTNNKDKSSQCEEGGRFHIYCTKLMDGMSDLCSNHIGNHTHTHTHT